MAFRWILGVADRTRVYRALYKIWRKSRTNLFLGCSMSELVHLARSSL